jgi:hypothetical protein
MDLEDQVVAAFGRAVSGEAARLFRGALLLSPGYLTDRGPQASGELAPAALVKRSARIGVVNDYAVLISWEERDTKVAKIKRTPGAATRKK